MKVSGVANPFRSTAHGSFKRQFVLTFSVGFFLLTVAFVAYLVVTERVKLYSDSTERAFGLAEVMKVCSLPLVLGNDVAGLQELVNAIGDHPELRYAMVLSSSGRVLAHSDPSKVGQFLADEPSLAFLKAPPQNQVITDDPSRIDVAVPLRFKTLHVGWARIALGRERITDKLHTLMWSSSLFVLFSIFLSLLAARNLANRLGTSISSLVWVADQVRAGNRAMRADAGRGPEEIAHLGESFNQMLDNLVNSEALYRTLFEEVPISLWEEDFSAVMDSFERLRASGITDFQQYFDDHPDEVERMMGQVAVRHVNGQTLRLLGATDIEAMYQGFSELLLPESLEGFKAELVALASGKIHFSWESALLSLRGERIDVRLDLYVPQGYEKSLSRVLVCISDFTERKKFEKALQRSEERYRIIAEFTYDCEYWQAPDGSLLFVSPSCEMQTGFRPEEFIEDPMLLARIVHPEDVSTFENHRRHTREVTGPSNLDFRILRRDGSLAWISHACRPVYGRDGAYLGRRVSNRDITERKELETRLAEVATYVRGLIEASPDPMLTINSDGRIADVNKRAEEMVGLPREQMIGTDYAIYCTDPEKARKAFAQVLAAGFMKDVTLSVRHVSGTITEYLFNSVVLRNGSGQVQGILTSARDITELKRLEMELRDLNEDLERRIEEEVARSHEKDLLLINQSQQAAMELRLFNESLKNRVRAEVAASRDKDHMLIQQSRLAAMGEMVHNIAHQWRQPLHGLSLILGNIRDSYAFKELTQETLDMAIHRAQTLLQGMSKTIDDFRDFFRPDHEPGEFDVSGPVKDALVVMEAALKNSDIEVVTSLPAGLKTYGHANQFAQAVLNVIANAKEAIQQQHVTDGRIEISLVGSGDRGVLTIQDNGGGIPREILPKIFDPYFTSKVQGSGIGLYMTKIIVERNLKGAIEAANLGAGARITLSLPLVTQGTQS